MAIKGKVNFGDVIRAKVNEDSNLGKQIESERFNLDVAQEIYEARTQAGLTQAALAKAVGTSQSVIARLEDADYDGHTLRMLNRIADALNCRVRVEICPRPISQEQAATRMLSVKSNEIDWNLDYSDNDFWQISSSPVKQG